MLDGYKTWIGIIITVLGAIGLGYLITATQLGDLIDAVLKIVGIAITVYGNFKAHQTIAALKVSNVTLGNEKADLITKLNA